MVIAFDTIPTALRVPFVGVEIDNSRAAQGSGDLPYRYLLVGQKTSSGSGAANTLERVTRADDVGDLAGRNSFLFKMAERHYENNEVAEVWTGILDDDSGGAAAAGSFAFTGTATEAGTVALYIGTRRVTVGVAVGDTHTEVATAADDAIGEISGDLPVTESIATATVTLTANNDGAVMNDLPLGHSRMLGEKLPAGISCTVTQMTGGTGNPELTDLIAAMGDKWFNVLTNPFTDATSLTALEAEFKSRFSGTRMIDGMCIGSAMGSHGTLTTLGETRNSPHSGIIAQPGTVPFCSSYEFAAAAAAAAGYSAQIDPARPFQTIQLRGVLPADGEFTQLPERNLLLYSGIATSANTAAGDAVELERLITTYRLSAAGASDESYMDMTTMFTLMFLRWSYRNWMRNRYPRHKLASDGAKIPEGQPIITPAIAVSEAIAWFIDMEKRGLVENRELFKQHIAVERLTSRINIVLPPDIMNQLIVLAAKIQFIL